MRVAECSYSHEERHPILAHVLAFCIGVGAAVRSPGREDDFGPCHQPAVPMVGLDVDLEYRRCFGCQHASIDRTVRLLLPLHLGFESSHQHHRQSH